MKLSTATSVLFQHTLWDAIPLIAKAGYSGIDIWGGRPHLYRHDYSAADLTQLSRRLEAHALHVSSFMPAFYRYPHSLSNPNSKVTQDSIEYMKICIDHAAALAAPIVLVVPDHSLYGQVRAQSLARFIDNVGCVADYAKQYPSMTLGIEILYDDETDFVNTADDALFILKQLGQNNLGVVLDSGTLNLSKESPAGIFNKLGSQVLQVHVNDNMGQHHQQNLIPGEGNYDFQSLIGFLHRIGYTGFITAELSKEYSSDPEPALTTTAQRLKGWIDTTRLA